MRKPPRAFVLDGKHYVALFRREPMLENVWIEADTDEDLRMAALMLGARVSDEPAFVIAGSNNLTTLYRTQRNRKIKHGLLITWRTS